MGKPRPKGTAPDEVYSVAKNLRNEADQLFLNWFEEQAQPMSIQEIHEESKVPTYRILAAIISLMEKGNIYVAQCNAITRYYSVKKSPEKMLFEERDSPSMHHS